MWLTEKMQAALLSKNIDFAIAILIYKRKTFETIFYLKFKPYKIFYSSIQ